MQIWQPPAVFFYLRLGFHSESKDVEVNRFKDTKSLRFAIIFNSSGVINSNTLEMFYLNSTLNFGIPPVLVFQLEVRKKDHFSVKKMSMRELSIVQTTTHFFYICFNIYLYYMEIQKLLT